MSQQDGVEYAFEITYSRLLDDQEDQTYPYSLDLGVPATTEEDCLFDLLLKPDGSWQATLEDWSQHKWISDPLSEEDQLVSAQFPPPDQPEPAQQVQTPPPLPATDPSRLLAFTINLKALQEGKLLGNEFLSLEPELRAELLALLSFNLNDQGYNKVVNVRSGEEIRFTAADCRGLKKRKDESLKKVMSIVLKVIYKQYLRSKGINQSFNPRTYIKREEINRRIFKKFFGRNPFALDSTGKRLYEIVDPALSASSKKVTKQTSQSSNKAAKQEVHLEHMRIFLIKNGVTRDWFEYATGQKGGAVNWMFFNEIIKILSEDKFMKSYKKKIDSMLGRIWGVGSSEAKKANLNNGTAQSLSEQVHDYLNEFGEQDENGTASADYDLSDSEEDEQPIAPGGKQSQKAKVPRTPKHPNSILQMKEAVRVARNSLSRFHDQP